MRVLTTLVAFVLLAGASVSTVSSQATGVLVPPPGLQPFADLRPGFPTFEAGGYSIQYEGAPGQVGQRGGGATLSGSPGSRRFDEMLVNDAVLRYANCAPDAAYCAAFPYVGDGPPTTEVFRGLGVASSPAVAHHITCCNGHYWSVTWYSAAANMTYSMGFEIGVADRYSPHAISAENTGAAQAIAGIAAQLVPVR